MEDAGAEPPRPSHNAHAPNRAGRPSIGPDGLPQHVHDGPPPPYSRHASRLGPGRKKLKELRNNKFVARRGGWKRLAGGTLIFALVTAATIAGSVAGLKRGQKWDYASPSLRDDPLRRLADVLRVRDEASDRSTTAGASTPPESAEPFPQGSYLFSTFLDTVSTGCVEDPRAFTCYPYQTYSESAAQSAFIFNWIIAAATDAAAKSDFTISSSENPFALAFTDVPLRLVDEGKEAERYVFEIPADKVVVPTGPIGGETARLGCHYNDTSFEAQLFTKRPKRRPQSARFPASPSNSAASGRWRRRVKAKRAQYQPWPYAVQVEQTIRSGPGVPSCFKMVNGEEKDQANVDLGVAEGAGTCRCLYRDPQR